MIGMNNSKRVLDTILFSQKAADPQPFFMIKNYLKAPILNS